jgi:hypothetical protein
MFKERGLTTAAVVKAIAGQGGHGEHRERKTGFYTVVIEGIIGD